MSDLSSLRSRTIAPSPPYQPSIQTLDNYESISDVQYNTIKSFETKQPIGPCDLVSNHSDEVNYYKSDVSFLLVCIGLLLLLLTLIGFVGYWALIKCDKESKDKEFLKIYLYGIGFIIAIVILVLVFLIVTSFKSC